MVTNTADANEDSGSDSDADPDVVDEPSGSSSEDEYDESLQHACGTFEQLCASPRPETGGQSSPVEGEKPAPALSTGDPTTSPLGKGSSSPPRRLPSILKSAATTRPRKPRRRARRFSVGSKRYRTIKFPKDELRLKTVYPFLLDESEMEGKRGALAEVRANRKRDKEWKERFEATRRSSDSDDGEDWTTQGGRPRRSRFSLRASPLRASKAGHRENPLQAALQHDSDSDSDSDEDTAGAPSRRGLAESSSSDDEESSSSDDDESSSSDDDSSDGEIDADGEARTGARRKSPSRPPLPI